MNYIIDQAELFRRFKEVRARTEAWCTPLKTEDYVPQPMGNVSPPKWHLAHTTWFFEELVLKAFLTDYKEFNEDFSFLFNSYYNSVGERINRDNRGFLTRPTVKETYQYRNHVDENMKRLFNENLDTDILEIIELGTHHEEQHQELLMYDLKYILGTQPTFPIYQDTYASAQISAQAQWIEIDAGQYEIGSDNSSFCYDNEMQRHRVFLEKYAINSALSTNADYLEFIENGGYKKHYLWHSDGWAFINEHKINSPLYWHKIDGQWMNYTLAGLRPVNPSAPVQHVSLYEAFAFAHWKGCRLPTEAEWEVAQEHFQWGQLWEWTGSAYLPYPGFKKLEGALGEYNGKFMVSQHVLRGASIVTPPSHSRKTYRNFFYPDTRWVFNGIRLAK